MPSVFRLEGQGSTPLSTDTSTHASSILAINGILCGLAVISVAARMYVRIFMLKTVGIDDWLITGAALFGIGVMICFVGETTHGLGRHFASIDPLEFVKFLHWQYFHSILVTVGISIIKLSVAFFLLRLVTGKGFKWFLYSMIAFLIAFTGSSAGTIAFSCIPIRANWNPASVPNATCFSNNTFTAIGLFNSTINIITDVLFASLPIPIVWKLQVNLRTKFTLTTILSLGYFACAASIYKTVLQSRVLSNPDYTRNDSYFVWNSIELYIGILAASLPSLRPLFRSILETTRSITKSRRTGTNDFPGRHRYYIQEEGIGMESLHNTGKGNTVGTKSGNYDVRITTNASGSEEDGRSGKDSLDDILPVQGKKDRDRISGITKTVDVRVS